MFDAIGEWLQGVNRSLAALIGLIVASSGVFAFWKKYHARIKARRESVDRLIVIVDKLVEIPAAIERLTVALQTTDGWTVLQRLDRIDAELCMMARRTDLAMSQLDMAAAQTDDKGWFVEVSRALQRQTGRAREELMGKGWYDAIDERARGLIVSKWESAMRDGREFDEVFQWHKPDGKLILVQLAAWPMRSKWVTKACPPTGGYVVNSKRLDPMEWEEERERAEALRRRSEIGLDHLIDGDK